MKIAAAYIRVSTDDQIEYSPESQLKAIKEFAKRNDMIIPKEFIYVDEGISGRKAEKRPAFMSMISAAKSKPAPFECILVWKFSRFARNREDSIVYKSMLKKQCKIDVLSVSEPLSDDKTSILIEAMLEAMDEYYSINLSEEVKRGMTEKATRGEPLSIPPFGYTMENKQLVINPDEARIVKMIFTEFANGVTYRELAARVNNIGIKSHRGNLFETRTISYILNNPVYIGKIRWNPNGKTRRNFDSDDIMIVDGHHEPIITTEMWDKAHEEIKRIKTVYKRHEKPFTFSNMLQGIVRCSACGGTLIKNGNYLQCQRYVKALCHTSHSISYANALESIIQGFEHDFRTGKLNVTKITPDVGQNEIEILNSQINRETQKLARVKQAYEDGIDTLEEYKENKKRITKTIDELKKQLPSEKPKTQKQLTQELIDKYKDVVIHLKDDDSSIEEKNKTLRSFVDRVVFNRKDNTFDFYYYL